jgi:Animal haem peroxidase
MSGKHSEPIRGLTSAVKSQLFEGRFGRMFRSLPGATFGHDEDENVKNLTRLAHKMTNSFDAPKDGKDDEESGIPALYTYFGQFIDHDITFDPASSLQAMDDPAALTDYRTPALDLDNVYGRGPDDQPYMYDGNKFLLGDAITGGDAHATDLPRNIPNPSGAPKSANGKPRRALIGDPRNDENIIVSQFQGLFHRFHNRVVDENPKLSFSEVQQEVRFHYQYLVLNDFLPRIVHSSVIADLKSCGQYDPEKLTFFHWKDEPFMPVEFSVAAYRLGHSMVRPGYRLNDKIRRPIFPVSPKGKRPLLEGLTGFREMPADWGIDWGRFIDIDIRSYDGSAVAKRNRLQFAYRIDTSVVFPLGNLPLPAIVSSRPLSLPQRNLERGWRMEIPSGQDVARAMGIEPLSEDRILIGQGTEKPDPKAVRVKDVHPVFKGNCPLWTYVLAEAMQNMEPVKIPVKESIQILTPRLGPVGGRIVAEVFLGLLSKDSDSMLGLDPNWQPETGPDYRLKDFVKFALGK